MICKSYQVEDDLKLLNNNISLFYGENLGLINFFKDKLIFKYHKDKILRFNQQEILDNEKKFFEELNNVSLFDEKKIFIIQDVNDKLLSKFNEILENINENRCYLFSGILEKKSKLRNFFEKEKILNIIPCYPDNDLSIKKLIQTNLRDYLNVTPNVINVISENCGNDRIKLYNEINKIKSYFIEKKIDFDDLFKLLNNKEDIDFNLVKDSALCGDVNRTNKLLNSFVIENEKLIFYLSTVNYRLEKLKNISEQQSNNIEDTISKMKPPIFWKDKPVFIKQVKIWNKYKLNNALNKSYAAEIKIKSNSDIDKKIIIKKLIVDICNLAIAA